MLGKFESLSINTARGYSLFLASSHAALERLVTGTVWKSSWFNFVKLMINLAPNAIEVKLDSVLQASSRRDILGKNVTDAAWQTYLTLARISGFSNRDLRIAAGRNYVDSDGKIIVDLNRERFVAFTAWIAIFAQTLVCVSMILLLWSKFEIALPPVFILIEIIILMIATVLFLVMLLAFAYSVFLRGVLPLAVAHNLRNRQWNLTLDGIPCQFIG